jgi:type I restriction enzyme R subunit
VVSEGQIRLVAQTFRNKLLLKSSPAEPKFPSPWFFAEDGLHADDIVKIIPEEFGEGHDFCKRPRNPRIAVTVNMIATGPM